MLKETSLSVARREPQEHLVVRASRKAELSVAAQFENWLLNNNYRPTTAFDYQGRIERLCRKEGYTLSHLAENIASILPEYEINGKQSAYGKRSHTSVRQALRRFKMFLVSNNLIESIK